MNEFQITQELEEKIRQAETTEEIIQICAEAGIQVTKEQLEADFLQKENGELNEDVLDNVSGGALFYIVRKIASLWGSSSGRPHSGGGRRFGG